MHQNGNGSRRPWWSSPWRSARNGKEDLDPYRRLAIQLHYDSPQGKISRSALIASPNDSPLAARCCLNVALCMAEQVGRRLLVVDASPTNPELSRLLGSEASPGITDYLTDPSVSLDSLLLPTSDTNIWFLPAGTKGSAPAAPERVQYLLQEGAQQHDFLLLAGGSVLSNALALGLAPFVGSVLLSITEHLTTMEDLDAAEFALSHCRAQRTRLILATPVSKNGNSRN